MIANKKYSGMEARQNIDAEEDRAIDNSVPSVDDVIRAITGQSPRQSVDEIIGAVTELVEIELENRGPQGGGRWWVAAGSNPFIFERWDGQ